MWRDKNNYAAHNNISKALLKVRRVGAVKQVLIKIFD